jgi:hypothetical protein
VEVYLREYSSEKTFYVDDRGKVKDLNKKQQDKIFLGALCDDMTLRELYFSQHPDKDREPPVKKVTKITQANLTNPDR